MIMSQINLNPAEVLSHLKLIIGSDLNLTNEQFKSFLHDLRKLIKKDKKNCNESSDNLNVCACHCHFQVSSTQNLTEDMEYESMDTDCTKSTTNYKSNLKLEVKKPAPSFIRPWRTRPANKVRKDGDPVQLYQQYKNHWQQYRIPGEQKHATIRWNIREKMLGQGPQPRPKPVISAQSSYR